MGKSISGSSLQASDEPPFQKALFGQDKWGREGRVVNTSSRSVVLAVGESSLLDVSKPIQHMNVKLNWTAPLDLDLHAFVKLKSGGIELVNFANKASGFVRLDYDAGIGDEGGQNEENIYISSIENMDEVLFATKIFSKGGSFADYDGEIVLTTSNGEKKIVPLSATQQADWCIIAKLDNSKPAAPKVVNINKVNDAEPNAHSF
jgi:uncharacterized protein involved in tellurium resistance